jgi:CFEM domain
MQFQTILAALALAATSVLSQNLTGLPTCAATCFTDNFANSACNSTNVACLCADSTFFTDVEICVLTTCDSADTTSKSLSYAFSFGCKD